MSGTDTTFLKGIIMFLSGLASIAVLIMVIAATAENPVEARAQGTRTTKLSEHPAFWRIDDYDRRVTCYVARGTSSPSNADHVDLHMQCFTWSEVAPP